MKIQFINTGTSPNSGNGDTLRLAFTKINHNFGELYSDLLSAVPSAVGEAGRLLGSDGQNIIWIDAPSTNLLSAGTYTFALSTGGELTLNGATVLKQGYAGSAGVGYAGSAGAGYIGSAGVTYVSNTPPDSFNTGTVWYNSTSGRTYVRFDDSWVDASPSEPGFIGSQGASGAMGYTGSGGNATYVSDTEPTITNTGTLWFNSVTGRTYVRFDDSWVDASPSLLGYVGSTGIGFTGSQGELGPQGGPGYAGSAGCIGFTGSQGCFGFTGSQGELGPQGGPGYAGSQGDIGFTGSQGACGVQGYAGSQGCAGFVGSQGACGYTGSVGFTGSIGFTGSQGEIGFIGSTGACGYTGSVGFTGSIGFAGSQGVIGFAGSQGYCGSQGYTGSQGYYGSQGYNGSQGYTGSIGFVGSVGTSSFTTSRVVLTGQTNSLANNQTATIVITGFKTYVLSQMTTSVAAWVRLYSDAASQTADASRLPTADPLAGSGLMAEVITTPGRLMQRITPGIMGFNLDNPVTNNVYATVTNLSGSSNSVTVTLTVLQLEA